MTVNIKALLLVVLGGVTIGLMGNVLDLAIWPTIVVGGVWGGYIGLKYGLFE